MATLAIIGIIYGALVTLAQTDMKKLIAYSSVSHLGFVMLGMFALNRSGLEGSVLQMVNHGLSTGGLFLLVGLIYERRHTKEIAEFGGLANVMPIYATFTLIIFLASMGLPLLNGFVGEFMILQGAFAANRVWAYWAVSGVVLGAALPALALPARLLGQAHARGEQGARGPQRARDRRRSCRSSCCASGSASTRSRSSISCTSRRPGWRRSSSPRSSGRTRRWRRLPRATRRPRPPSRSPLGPLTACQN